MSTSLGEIDGVRLPIERNGWVLREDDFTLYAMLSDAVYMPELVWKDPTNHEYAGAYRVHPEQYQINRCEEQTAVFACGRATGKALALETPVLAPDGWVLLEDVEVGMDVVGSDGQPTLVTGVFDQVKRPVFVVEFHDRTRVECDDEHLWHVTCDHWEHRKTGARTLTTRELRQRKGRFRVPLVAPVEFASLPEPEISPWLVGALLGDGCFCSSTMTFSTGDQEMVDRVRQELPGDVDLVHMPLSNHGYDYRFRAKVHRRIGKHPQPDSLLRWSRERGLIHKRSENKFIPAEYLWGSITTRQEVLRGLVDTDGTICPSGGVEISSASKQLAEDLRHLVLSLGGRATVNQGEAWCDGKRHLDRHRVFFYIEDMEPCWLPRKRSLFQAQVRKRRVNRSWRNIVKIARTRKREPMRCISVAAEDGLFVIDQFVLTHNTMGQKSHSQVHCFTSPAEDMLMTAPELIHLLPLTDAVEDSIRESRLLRECLDVSYGKTGFTHRPFGVNLNDGTKLIGRIPKLKGTGVLGMHAPFVMVEESQSYPSPGWANLEETVNYDAVDKYGRPRWRYWAFGVHDGNRQSGFSERAKNDEWKVIQVTRLQRADWGKEAKERAKASYGGTSSPDYRRNILGEPGDAASAYFVTARLLSCCDQRVERGEVKGSDYNTKEYQKQTFRAEELETDGIQIADALDLPHGYQSVYGGVDVGLNRSPTVISLFTEMMVSGKLRLKLFRRFTLERLRSKQIRQALYAIDLHFGGALMGMGVDSTGLGLPLMQELQDDEVCPPHLMQVMRGYFFSSKVAVAVAPENVYRDEATGVIKDQYGRMLEEQTLPDGSKRFIVWAPFITASTNYLARWVDTGYLLLPFDQEVIQDMLGETKERVERLQSNAERAGGAMRKPDIFHILDSFRGMAMAYHATDIEEALALPQQRPVFDQAF